MPILSCREYLSVSDCMRISMASYLPGSILLVISLVSTLSSLQKPPKLARCLIFLSGTGGKATSFSDLYSHKALSLDPTTNFEIGAVTYLTKLQTCANLS